MVYFIGVDVGTGSARAALVTSDGNILKQYIHTLKKWQPCAKYYEQSSDDIWNSVCLCVKELLKDIDVLEVKGISFVTTSSLVALDKDGCPVSVSPTGINDQNVIMWMDHRAANEANMINDTNREILKNNGMAVSPEMSISKLVWLKQNMPTCWENTAFFMELPDFLTYKATGSTCRSLANVVSKWMYELDPTRGSSSWNCDFLETIGLSDLCDNNFSKIGNKMLFAGEDCGDGLTAKAANELGLTVNTRVGASLIDARAGGVGCIGCSVPELGNIPLVNRMVLICGTSAVTLTVKEDKVDVKGMWGPHNSSMINNMWTHAGGQTACGKLIDHILETHPAYKDLEKQAASRNVHIHSELNNILEQLAEERGLTDITFLTKDLHIWPDYHGNRLIDSSLTGMISGLTLSTSIEDLSIKYLAVIQALAYSTRHIIETLNSAGYDIKVIHACGGLSKNSLYIQTHADVTGLPIVLPHEKESVLLGSALLGAIAAEKYSNMQDAMSAMCGSGDLIRPRSISHNFHHKKYEVFQLMVKHQLKYRSIMNDME